MFKSQLQEILNTLNSAIEDAEKFDSGNDAAGKRVRMACQRAKTSLQTIRNEIQAERNSRKA